MKIIIQVLSLGNQKIIGSTYEYYVKGLDGDREFTSDTKSATITTGVKKYRYYLTSDNDEIPDKLREQDKVEKAKGRVRWYKWRLEHGLATEKEYRKACEKAKTLGIQEETEA